MIRRQDTRVSFLWIGFNVGELGKTLVVFLLITLAIIFAEGQEEDDFYHPDFLLRPFHYSNTTPSIQEIINRANENFPYETLRYDKFRQPNNNGTPTDIRFQIIILNVDNINEDLMTYEVEMLLIEKWKDARLRVKNRKKEKDYQELDMDWIGSHLWRPNWLIKSTNLVNSHDMAGIHHFFRLYNDKTVMYVAKFRVVLLCHMKFEKYPHDTQFCTMEIQSRTV
ncbi:unnamed protein product [Orchesella dallaii]|uniref:Neurotransmitter-gated ion-channel ligand-binding domain-containing protein n=1 Tax=Orchesella dallaii TaxID=48710 RepID=A0ABP1QDI0_9HEXA